MGRKGDRARRTIEAQQDARWFRLICDQRFQARLNDLRRLYKDWVVGPPMTATRFCGMNEDDMWSEEEDISRKDVDRPDQVDEREDSFIMSWRRFERRWRINLPRVLLGELLPDLSFFTLDRWLMYGRITVNPTVMPVTPGLGDDTDADTLLLRLECNCPEDLLIAQVTEAIRKAKGGRQSKDAARRNRYDNLIKQVRVFEKAARGYTVPQIASWEKRSVQTIKSRLAAAVKWIGIKPVTGKEWKKWHIDHCSICRNSGCLSYQNCPVAQSYMKRLPTTKKTLPKPPHYADRPERRLLPPRPLQSEKSVFGKWDS